MARAGSFLRDGDRVRPMLEAPAPTPAVAAMPRLGTPPRPAYRNSPTRSIHLTVTKARAARCA